MNTIMGLLVGFLFGFLLQKGGVLKYEGQQSAMQLRDLTMFRFMITAMVVGAIGMYFLNTFGIITLTHEPFSIFGVVVGGLVFGIGWSLLGYCPGTAVGALGEGQLDAIFGIIGLITGSLVYSVIYPQASKLYENTKIFNSNGGNPSLYDIMPGWLAVTLFAVGAYYLFKLFKKLGV